MRYEYHPYTEIWPLMEGNDFDEFALDIAAHGLRTPILIYREKVLDGRNRDRACEEAGVEPRYEQAQVTCDEEALDLVVSLNTKRRHLTLEQRAFAAARLATLKQGSNRFKAKVDSSQELSTKQPMVVSEVTLEKAAKSVGASLGSAKRARAILNHAPEKEKDVVAKKVNLTETAAAVSPPRKSKQATKATAKKSKDPMRGVVAAKVPNIPGSIPTMTREQVDPEFTGTNFEFTQKYGHVWVETAEQRATARFTQWALHMKGVLREVRRDMPSEVDLNWLRSPKAGDIKRGRETYDELAKVMETFRLMIEKAEATGRSLSRKGNGSG